MLGSPQIYRLLALVFASAATFHAAALVWPQIAEPAAPWSHALFVLINAALAAGVLRRPPGFVLAYALFTVEQLISHGRSGWLVWRDEHRVDWASGVTVLFVPLVLGVLVADARARRFRGTVRSNQERP